MATSSQVPTARHLAVSLLVGGGVAAGTLSVPAQSSLVGLLVGAAGLGLALLAALSLQVAVILVAAVKDSL